MHIFRFALPSASNFAALLAMFLQKASDASVERRKVESRTKDLTQLSQDLKY